MARYARFEENEDGTCTAEIKPFEDQDAISFLVPMSFESFFALMEQNPEALAEARRMAQDTVILIPNSPNNLET